MARVKVGDGITLKSKSFRPRDITSLPQAVDTPEFDACLSLPPLSNAVNLGIRG